MIGKVNAIHYAFTFPHKVRQLKGEVSRKIDVISKPKSVFLTTETKKK